MPDKHTIIFTATEHGWRNAVEAGQYTQSTIMSTLAEVGFIHATFPDQTIDMANRHFTDRNDVLILLADADKLQAPLRYEPALSGRPGTFPHLYGPLNLDAVYATAKLEKDAGGKFFAPEALENVQGNTLPCDIVLLPSVDVASRAIDLSGSLQAYQPLMRLGPDGPFPHISLYMVRLRTAELEQAKKLLADVAVITRPFGLTAERYSQAKGYLDAEYTRTKPLDILHLEILALFNPLRAGMADQDKILLTTTTGKEHENLEKYGQRWVDELFRPHLTLTRFAGGRAIDTATLPEAAGFSGQFISLGLFETEQHGTCTRKIAEFALGGRRHAAASSVHYRAR